MKRKKESPQANLKSKKQRTNLPAVTWVLSLRVRYSTIGSETYPVPSSRTRFTPPLLMIWAFSLKINKYSLKLQPNKTRHKAERYFRCTHVWRRNLNYGSLFLHICVKKKITIKNSTEERKNAEHGENLSTEFSLIRQHFWEILIVKKNFKFEKLIFFYQSWSLIMF